MMEWIKGRGKPQKLSRKMLRILILGWILPMTLLCCSVFYVVSQQLKQQTKQAVETAMETAVDICETRLETVIQSSRNASYIPSIKESWLRFQEDGNSQKLYNGVSDFLAKIYKYDENFLSTMVYFWEGAENNLYYMYSSIANADYDSVHFFRQKGRGPVEELAERIDTNIGFIKVEDHLYMVRNIVNRDFKPFATIVMDLDQETIFGSLKGVSFYESMVVCLNGRMVYREGGARPQLYPYVSSDEKNLYSDDENKEAVKVQEDGRREFSCPCGSGSKYGATFHEVGKGTYVCRERTLEGNRFHYTVTLNRDALYYERNSMMYVLALMLLCAIPLMAISSWFLYRNVSEPVKHLVDATHQIEQGRFGYQLETRENSEEFSYLVSSFNSMSDKLKNQFEQIYLEELALKDADIKALQSQINPHFLNNTLEIINWEARMGGNEKVSSMIEALSTMLEATLNRKRQPMISLSEELEYVNAYCYIIKKRFGDRLLFEQEIDSSLLTEEVPRLIIQPIIENAVEHGLGGRKGKILTRISRKEDMMYIEIYNDGALSAKDKERIAQLLSGSAEEDKAVSLGIRNVNKRLKIIYGNDSGLTIRSDKDGRTVSILKVKLHK